MKAPVKTILYADDDPDDLALFREAVSALGGEYYIIEAMDGIHALELLRQMQESNELPCLIVLDINMPKVNGRDACVQIKKDSQLAEIPMIIFSTSNSKLDKLFFETKNVEYITKPTDYDVLVSLASRMLGQCQTA